MNPNPEFCHDTLTVTKFPSWPVSFLGISIPQMNKTRLRRFDSNPSNKVFIF